MSKVTFEIKEHIGVLSTAKNGWTKEANMVAWNGGVAKLDIRQWDADHERMSKGISLTEDETKKLVEILSLKFGAKN